MFSSIKHLPHSLPTLSYFFVFNTQAQVKPLKKSQQQFCIFIAEADVWLKHLLNLIPRANSEKLLGFE